MSDPGEEPIREVLTIRSPTAQETPGRMGKEMVEQDSCSPPHRKEAKDLVRESKIAIEQLSQISEGFQYGPHSFHGCPGISYQHRYMPQAEQEASRKC
jgi:hypothetical protein